ncbi:MAG: riboflavin synthase, partial [Acidobacteria bacterium]|nr:riboflavin synthase [Acidobacteriota bacterium]
EFQRGASIAVSGVCLTVAEFQGSAFTADLALETVQRTSLAHLQPGSLVNLELPARAGDRMGGHIVQGHVDGVAEVIRFDPVSAGQDYWLAVRVPAHLARYIVEKGSIALEGISLTVARIQDDEVSVAIIPHTREVTNLKLVGPGAMVNVEVDVLAKYAEKLGNTCLRRQAEPLSVARLAALGF